VQKTLKGPNCKKVGLLSKLRYISLGEVLAILVIALLFFSFYTQRNSTTLYSSDHAAPYKAHVFQVTLTLIIS
jgi:flagellar biosynthesis/type III secretory pathway M-ring protein FliF/YscJ